MSLGFLTVMRTPNEKVASQNRERQGQAMEVMEQEIGKTQGHQVEQVVVQAVMEDLVVVVKIQEEEMVMGERETTLRRKKRKRKHRLQVQAVDSM